MPKFEQYFINLRDLKSDSQVFEFTLDNVYLKKIDSPEVKEGNVKVFVTVKKKLNIFEFAFLLKGVVQVPCNRCLDEMEQPVECREKLQVKFGNRFSEENDTVIVPEAEGGINIAWFLYEFIVLNIPIKHVHPPGECNKAMMSKLKKHITRQKSDDDDSLQEGILDIDDDDDVDNNEDAQTDPRWEGLQNIFENN